MKKYFFQTVPLIRCVIPSCGVEQTDRMEPLMSQLYFHCISIVFILLYIRILWPVLRHPVNTNNNKMMIFIFQLIQPIRKAP